MGYRLWTKEEKRQVVAEATRPGMSVSVVSRQYDINANLIFKWIDQFAEKVDPQDVAAHGFMSLGILDDRSHHGLTARSVKEDNGITIELRGDIRVRVVGSFNEESLGRVVAVITRLA
jgi:transposase